jgi:hypothetical protein
MHFPANAGLIFLTGELTNDRYLVDTEATLSNVPCNQNSSPSGPLLKGADGQTIPSWGFFKKTVQFQGKLFTSTFLQAAVAGPILGIDFLRKFNVIVSPVISQIQFACSAAATPANILPSAALSASFFLSSSTLVLAPVLIPPPTAMTSSQPPAVSAYLVRNPKVKSSSFSFRENQSLLDSPPSYKKIPDSMPDDVKTLLEKFPSILCTGDVKQTPNHGIVHHIRTGSHPLVFVKFRCLDPEKLQIAKAEFKRFESAGIVRRSKSPWASPLHMVPKNDGSWQPCGVYRRLNLVITPDKYPLSNMQDPSNGLHSCTIFSKIDLVKGYHQIPLATQDIPKTAIITPFGLFEYLFTPFGLYNAAQTFQRMMDRTTDCLEGVFAYMDDLRVSSPDRQTHLRHL